MPEKIKSIAIALDGQKHVYRPGEDVRGYWELTSEKEFTTKGIVCTFQAVAFVKWTETNFASRTFEDDEFVSLEVYGRETKQLHGHGETKETLKPGVYKFPFSYKLPQIPIPSSYEGPKGAIRYFLQLTVRRPIPYPNVVRYQCITVLEIIDVNLQLYRVPMGYTKKCQVPKALGLGNAGSVDLWGRIDRRAYCPGEKIAISVIAKNNSTQKLGKVKAQLMQYVTFTGNGKDNYVSTTIKVLQSTTELESGGVFKWTNMLMLLDAIPPTVNRPTCQCIRVHYCLEVVVPVPLLTGSDLKLVFPIIIGTIPLGKSLYHGGAPKGGVHVVDASKAITYTQCNKGWSAFRESSNSRNIPLMTYTPMCAYAVTYIFKDDVSNSPKSTVTTKPSVAVKSNYSKGSASNTVSSMSSQSVLQPSAPPQETAAVLQPKQPLPNTQINKADQDVNIPDASDGSHTDEQVESDIFPPSYEESVGLQDNIADDDAGEEELDIWYMIIRLTKPSMQELIEFMQKNRKFLEEKEVQCLFRTTKALSPKGSWPKERDVIMLSFPSKKQAFDWLSTREIKQSKWLPGSDIMVTKIKEQYQTDKALITITEYSKIEEEEDALTRYRNLINNILKPIRLVHGGQLLINGNEFEVVQGTWKTRFDSNFSIVAWSNLQSLQKYRSSIAELNQTMNELKEKCLIIHSYCSFDIEELTLNQTEENETMSSS